MADLTLYFPSSGAAPHNCAYSGFWDATNLATRYPSPTSKGSSGIATHGSERPNGETYGLGMQWVSAALAAREWTTSDTFDIAIICRDQNYPTTTCYLALSVRVFNAAGDTVIGTLYEGVVNAVAMAASYTNRHADGVSVQNNVSLPENGHIVIEVGFSSAYAATFGADYVIGEGSSTALPLNDTETNTDLYPYIAFTYGAAEPEDTELVPANCAFALACQPEELIENLTLVMQSAAHALASSTPTLVELRTLTVQAAALGHASSTPTLVEHKTLAVQGAAHAHAASAPALVQAHTLAVQSCAVALAADNLGLGGNVVLTVSACAHASASSTPTLNELRTLAVNASAIAHAASVPTLNELRTLAVAECALAHVATSPTVTVLQTLEVNASAFTVAAETPTTTTLQVRTVDFSLNVLGEIMTVASAALGLTSSTPTLSQVNAIAVANAALAVAASVPTLVENRTLEMSAAACASASDNIDIDQYFAIAPSAAAVASRTDADVFVNGGFEDWPDFATPGGWTASVSGPCSLNLEAADVHGGAYAVRLDIGASGWARLNRTFKMTPGAAHTFAIWTKTAASRSMYITIRNSTVTRWLKSDGTWSNTLQHIILVTGGSWYGYSLTFNADTATDYYIEFGNYSAAGSSIYIDDVSLVGATPMALHQGQTLAVDAAAHAHASSTPTLNELRTLEVSPAAVAHAATAPAPAVTHILETDMALLGHVADAFGLTQAHRLAVNASVLGHATGNILLTSTTAEVLEMNDAAFAGASTAFLTAWNPIHAPILKKTKNPRFTKTNSGGRFTSVTLREG